jgi:hypothetical protein
MADELTREQVSSRLEAIFSSAMDGKELAKALASIEKRLDKFEGKWGGLIKWAEKKYGSPEETEKVDEEKLEEEVPETSPHGQDESPAELSREVAFNKLESIFREHLEGNELDKMIGSIDKRLDKFEGKWPKLILWAEEKYGPADSTDDASEEVSQDADGLMESSGIEETLELIIHGDSDAALHNLKNLISRDPSNSDAWNAFSTYYGSIGFSGRAKACEEKAESLS